MATLMPQRTSSPPGSPVIESLVLLLALGLLESLTVFITSLKRMLVTFLLVCLYVFRPPALHLLGLFLSPGDLV